MGDWEEEAAAVEPTGHSHRRMGGRERGVPCAGPTVERVQHCSLGNKAQGDRVRGSERRVPGEQQSVELGVAAPKAGWGRFDRGCWAVGGERRGGGVGWGGLRGEGAGVCWQLLEPGTGRRETEHPAVSVGRGDWRSLTNAVRSVVVLGGCEAVPLENKWVVPLGVPRVVGVGGVGLERVWRQMVESACRACYSRSAGGWGGSHDGGRGAPVREGQGGGLWGVESVGNDFGGRE